VLGALIIEPAQQYLTTQFTNSYLSQILLGALFLAVVLFLPRGLVPTAAAKGRGWLEQRSGRRDAPAPAEDGDGGEDGAAAGMTSEPAATSKGPAS
jgi:hypothetical protein